MRYDRHHGVRPLPPLEHGDPVLVRTEDKWKKEGVIVAADTGNRTYLVNTPTGVQRRNRKHLQKLPSQQPEITTPTVPTSPEKTATPVKTLEQPVELPTSIPAAVTPHVTRMSQGIAIAKPLRFRDTE